MGVVGVASCVILALIAIAYAAFLMHVKVHKDTVRAAKIKTYTTSQARVHSTMCTLPNEMAELGTAGLCADANQILSVPLETAVEEEAWDNALRAIYDKATGFSGLMTVCVCIVVVVGAVLQCVWCLIGIPSTGVLPG